jgi:hypothetical protein
MAVADFNGDGKPDLALIANSATGPVALPDSNTLSRDESRQLLPAVEATGLADSVPHSRSAKAANRKRR